MAKPELGLKRLCPNCGAKYYDLNRDPIVCPKCNAAFATGVVGVRPETANEEEDEVDADEGVDLVALEDAVDADADEDGLPEDEEDVDVDADDDVLVEEVGEDEVSDVVRGTDTDEDDER